MMFSAMKSMMEGDKAVPDPERPGWWLDIVRDCALSQKAICDENKFNQKTFRKWIKGDQMPREKNRERIVAVMRTLIEQKKLVRHPSFGYATEEQIKKLNELGLGPDRDRILAQIEKQNKLQGKLR